MGFFNFGKKDDEKKEKPANPQKDAMMGKMDEMLDKVDDSKLSRKERWALKLFKKMPQAKKKKRCEK